MKRLSVVLGTAAVAAGIGIVSFGSDIAAIAGIGPQSRIGFSVDREGSPLGTHATTIVKNGETVEVTVNIEFQVDLAFFTLYRYSHESKEVWRDGKLQTLNSTTDDDGTPFAVTAVRDGDIIRVTGEEGTIEIPGDTLPTSYWNPAFIQQSTVLDSQRGKLIEIDVTAIEQETIDTPTGRVDACRYRLTGDLKFDIWYDDLGRWVALYFKAKGSDILYTLDGAPIDREFLVAAATGDAGQATDALTPPQCG
ncbi:MAG: DUF6134 family protein [Pseudomonadota bacterium]